ncbi:DegT/DnrJ/EryC1/StrS family aminotransferase [Candidatus Bathyarchaeota archaeon]|nr:DegT/DnrJ/EryC1/StrS family aminotransferase [Candidatus Bathyarchaeota archaeon]
MIPINAPQIGEEEINAVVEVLRSGILTHSLGEGPYVKKFEMEFAKFVDVKYALAVNSGTAALHMAVLAAGVNPGDEVILPSFTFVATAEAVVLAGARPVFVDIDPVTYNVAPEKIEKAITSKTKAVIAVDLYGAPADLKPIREIADKHGLKVIEDAAQAHGAIYEGKPVGFYADMACWSFYASKNMTTGEGGMITTSDAELVEKLQLIRNHGEKEKYLSLTLGHNYRMSEMQAAIGCVQLAKLPSFLAKRRFNAEKITEKLREAAADKLQLPIEAKNCRNSWYLYTVRLKNASRAERDRLIHDLKLKGIGAEVYYAHPIHRMPYYKRFGEFKLPETEKASEQVFSLPVHPGVTHEQADYISETLLKLLR